jgi:CheY-like chemotaxis protein
MHNLREGGRFHLRVVQGGLSGRGAGPGERRQVIVVDDEETSRELFTLVLKQLDCPLLDVRQFAEPVAALSYAREHDVDLGLIDFHLGRDQMDGLQLVDRIRSETPGGPGFSAILITADTEPTIVDEATRHNVAAVMGKAVDLYELAQRCCALLRLPPPPNG